MTIPGDGKALVKTDLAIALPDGCYGRVGMCVQVFLLNTLYQILIFTAAPRSSLSWKHHIDVGGND